MTDHEGPFGIRHLGDRVAIARKAKNMTQSKLSAALGISRAAVSLWESGATAPSITKLEEVGLILDVEPEWLIFGFRTGDETAVTIGDKTVQMDWIELLQVEDSSPALSHKDWFGFPHGFLERYLKCDASNIFLCEVGTLGLRPDYNRDDVVFIDRSDMRPSPAGHFLYHDGIGLSFASMNPVPGPTPMVKVSSDNATAVTLPLSEVKIIGRVKGRYQRA